MTSSSFLVPALLGLAVVGRGVTIRGSGNTLGATTTRPFDPAVDAILIYSEGKTGTTSLQDSAGAMMEPPCHVSGDGAAAHRSVKCHVPECAVAFLKNRPEGSRTWVISSNRNPFAMYPSTLFQGVGHWSQGKIDKVTMDKLFEYFHERAPSPLHGLPHEPVSWYKVHYYDTLGLNVTAHPFDFSKNFLHLQHTWKNRHLEVLVVRLEDSSQWERVLKPFFPKVKLLTSNVASDKSYAAKYKEFLSIVEYTDVETEMISQSESLNHFYTHQEKSAFIAGARDQSSRLASCTPEDFVLEQEEEEGMRLQHC